MRTTYYSLGRNLHQRATLTSKVASLLMPKRCSGAGEAIVPLIQDPQKFMEGNLYLEDDAISPLFQGAGIPDLFGYIVQSSSFKTQSTAACSCMCSHSSCQTKCFKWSLHVSVNSWRIHVYAKNDHALRFWSLAKRLSHYKHLVLLQFT